MFKGNFFKIFFEPFVKFESLRFTLGITEQKSVNNTHFGLTTRIFAFLLSNKFKTMEKF